jgi:hypothetical protein
MIYHESYFKSLDATNPSSFATRPLIRRTIDKIRSKKKNAARKASQCGSIEMARKRLEPTCWSAITHPNASGTSEQTQHKPIMLPTSRAEFDLANKRYNTEK